MLLFYNGIPYYNIEASWIGKDEDEENDLVFLGYPYDEVHDEIYITNESLVDSIKEIDEIMKRIDLYKTEKAKQNITDGLFYVHQSVADLTKSAEDVTHILLYVDLYTDIITEVYDMLTQQKPHDEILRYMDKKLNKDYYKKEWKR